jgi:hypothetical protein
VENEMRKIFMILSLCFVVNASATTANFLEEKIYVSSNNILIGDNGIFVKLDGQIVQVQMISYDSQGIFIEPIKAWKCPYCGRDYPAYEDECPICQKKKPRR